VGYGRRGREWELFHVAVTATFIEGDGVGFEEKRRKEEGRWLNCKCVERVASESFRLCNVRPPLRVQESPLSVGSRWPGGLRGVPVYVYPNTFFSEGSPPTTSILHRFDPPSQSAFSLHRGTRVKH